MRVSWGSLRVYDLGEGVELRVRADPGAFRCDYIATLAGLTDNSGIITKTYQIWTGKFVSDDNLGRYGIFSFKNIFWRQ